MEPSKTQQIDFLPQSYREQSQRRQRKVSRYVVVVIFGAGLLAASLWQLQLKRYVRKQIDTVRPLAEATNSQQQLLTIATGELTELKSQAQLYALLEHPWPATQILAAVLRELPAEVRVHEMRLTRESLEQSNRLAPASTELSPEGVAIETPSPPNADYQHLRDDAESTRHMIHLEGVAIDTGQLHRFLGRVTSSPLIERAVLKSLKADADRDANSSRDTETTGVAQAPTRVSTFEVVLTVSDSLSRTRSVPLNEQPELANRSER